MDTMKVFNPSASDHLHPCANLPLEHQPGAQDGADRIPDLNGETQFLHADE